MKKNEINGLRMMDERDELRERWLSEGDAIPFVRYLLEKEEMHAVSVVCQSALEEEEDSERRAELERLFAQTGRPPATWDDALVEFAADPSVEAWEKLFAWVPEDSLFHRLKTSIRRLRQLGVDPDILFLCASRWGTGSEAIALADTGAASPEVIMKRGEGQVTEAHYIALAAQSAALRGNQSRAVWLGNKAIAMGGDRLVAGLVTMDMARLWDHLDDDHRAMLNFEFPF